MPQRNRLLASAVLALTVISACFSGAALAKPFDYLRYGYTGIPEARVHRDIATCFLAIQPARAESVLIDYIRLDERGRGPAGCHPDTLPFAYRFDPDLLMGMLAEKLLAGRKLQASAKWDGKLAERYEQFGSCAVAVSPDAARQWIATTPFTREEAEAAKSLASGMAPCVGKSWTARVATQSNRALMRAAIAVAIYAAEMNIVRPVDDVHDR